MEHGAKATYRLLALQCPTLIVELEMLNEGAGTSDKVGYGHERAALVVVSHN
jgi:hypothetical protein